MALNPTWNQFNVAPVGPIIMVGHKRALSGGITRESAINLIAWLTIACEATPDEVAAEIEKAHTETPQLSAAQPTQVMPQQGRQAPPPMMPQQAPRPAPGGSVMVQRPSPTLAAQGITAPRVAMPGAAPARAPGGPLVGNMVAIQRPSPRLHGRPDDSAAVAATLDPNRPPPEATVMNPAGVVVRPPIAPKVPPATKPAPTVAPSAASTDGDPSTVGPETIPFVDRASLDPETEAALRDAEEAAAQALAEAPVDVKPVDENKVAAAWGNGRAAT
jgi:hypothetical protein